MFQGMFRKRGRPPEPLPIGGHDTSSNEESSQIPVHQLLETPRQLPLPSVRELESNVVVVQQERIEGNNELVQPSLSRSSQHVVARKTFGIRPSTHPRTQPSLLPTNFLTRSVQRLHDLCTKEREDFCHSCPRKIALECCPLNGGKHGKGVDEKKSLPEMHLPRPREEFFVFFEEFRGSGF